jgi:thiol peroxidase
LAADAKSGWRHLKEWRLENDAAVGEYTLGQTIDTGVCAASERKFNAEASSLENTVIVSISKDLPFALNRFCSAEGLKNVVPASELRNSSFSDAYGVKITEGPLAGLFSRAVVVINEKGSVVYSEQVAEITQEPNYEKALAAVKNPANV